MNIVIFGTGAFYRRYRKWLEQARIIAFLDNDPQKQGSELDGVPVFSPDTVMNLDADRIFVMSYCYRSMTEQLLSFGVSQEKIAYPSDLAELLPLSDPPIIDLPVFDGKGYRVVFLSDDLKFSGAQFALIYAAMVLKNNGCQVLIASPEHGKIERYIQDQGIGILIDETIAAGKMSDLPWIRGFDLIFLNTTTFYPLLINRDPHIPVIWWTHEPAWLLTEHCPGLYRKINSEQLYIYAVSQVAAEALKEMNPLFNPGILPLGLPEREARKVERNDRLLFLIVGEISRLKGPDLLVHALDQLNEEQRAKIDICFVGRVQNNYDLAFLDRYISEGTIRMIGEVDQEELALLYDHCDALLSTSREECLPTVAIEAMQHRKTVVIAENTGIATYLRDGYNALLFPSGDTGEIAAKLVWCIENREKLPEMGNRAFQVYERTFSMERFEGRILQIVRQIRESTSTEARMPM